MTLLTRLVAPALYLVLSAPAFAGEAKTDDVEIVQVVELFTSQGCSSCPPSNALVNDWSAQDSILALTYSVDYWDYLGWKDTFADPKFSNRQRAYSKALGHGRVYTPQMVINGERDKFRYARSQIKNVNLPEADLNMTLTDGAVSLGASEGFSGAASLELVTYLPGMQTVAVKRGENGGRDLTLTNVVTDFKALGLYRGQALSFALPEIPKGHEAAILIHDGDYGPILSAARLP